jgi:hypothetical protein
VVVHAPFTRTIPIRIICIRWALVVPRFEHADTAQNEAGAASALTPWVGAGSSTTAPIPATATATAPFICIAALKRGATMLGACIARRKLRRAFAAAATAGVLAFQSTTSSSVHGIATAASTAGNQ